MSGEKRSKGRSGTHTLGVRLRQLRQARGLTQTELARKVGVTQRVVTYYENEAATVSADLLAKFAKVLGVSADELLGTPAKPSAATELLPQSLRLWRKLKQVEALPPTERRQIVQLIEAFVERSELKRKKAS